jgi:hypothetical protein
MMLTRCVVFSLMVLSGCGRLVSFEYEATKARAL